MGAKDCPVTGAKLPLLIFSHGRDGWFGANHDTAEALADAGFVVAAINHPGDSYSDNSRRNSLSVLASRPVDVIRLLNFMLHDWKDRAAIDPARIGLFGFSNGGYTGLVLTGVTPDFRRVAGFCQEKTGECAQLHNGEAAPNPPHDARIKAAVIVDPASGTFTPDNLAAIKIPLQFWRSERGGPGVGDGSGNARVANGLPGKPDIHVVPPRRSSCVSILCGCETGRSMRRGQTKESRLALRTALSRSVEFHSQPCVSGVTLFPAIPRHGNSDSRELLCPRQHVSQLFNGPSSSPSIVRAVWKLMVAALRYLGSVSAWSSIRIATIQ
jgi:dienelactone hydrolase